MLQHGARPVDAARDRVASPSVVSARLHATGGASVLVLLAVLLDTPAVLARIPAPRPALIGVVLLAAGLVLTGLAQLMLGQQGMPRRYMTYIEQFTDLMRAGFVASGLAAVGLVVLVVAFMRGSRPD